ncbi:hypothetical protein CLV30_106170 [Haloactinopolyspora alba]|uniref:Uncharacterized protein n=1 Tax=Haloactinopolyspora alba TaxID=648780 RepID=A0A2P8E3W6_9ACTN|nr:hypothetical protein [Haloactinopolyspora alba]PSL04165.1 hypothetical protein CLV30_106170 [Haloactinopolyspora alba]
MRTPVNTRAALRLLEEVVEGNEGYVYEDEDGVPADSTMCHYVHRTEGGSAPGCIVGHALHRAGVPISNLLEIEGSTIGTEQAARVGVALEGRAVDVLSAAQAAQDVGETWGEALEHARAVAAEAAADDEAEVEALLVHGTSHPVAHAQTSIPIAEVDQAVLELAFGGVAADARKAQARSQRRRDLADEIQHLVGEHQGEANAWAELADRQYGTGDDDAALLSASQGDLHRHTVDVLTEAYRLLDR